jgi:hypothetical protein
MVYEYIHTTTTAVRREVPGTAVLCSWSRLPAAARQRTRSEWWVSTNRGVRVREEGGRDGG